MRDIAAIPTLPPRHRNEPCCAAVLPPALSQAQTDVLAGKLKALGDASRLRMLDLLAQQREPLCVCDITPQFSQNQPTVSHHLRLLREAGLIDTEKRGIWSYYWATEAGRAALSALQQLI
jgi:ArsR family transcriptional regulator